MAGFVPGILPSTLRAGKAVQIRSRRICRDRGARRHSRHYVEHSDRAKARQGVLLGRRSSGLVQHAG